MISRRQYLHHSILNATVFSLALCLGVILAQIKWSDQESALPTAGSAIAAVMQVEGNKFAGSAR